MDLSTIGLGPIALSKAKIPYKWSTSCYNSSLSDSSI